MCGFLHIMDRLAEKYVIIGLFSKKNISVRNILHLNSSEYKCYNQQGNVQKGRVLQMLKYLKFTVVFAVFAISVLFLSTGCSKVITEEQGITGTQMQQGTVENAPSDTNAPEDTKGAAAPTPESTRPPEKPPIDLNAVKPDESGKIMVVMFHNFVDTYKKGDKAYTTTFGDFRNLLNTLYDSGYRLISLSDYMNGNIDTPAGFIPIVFTFDDGTSGQFNLVEDNGRLVVNGESAVGIMEEFAGTHPDFGLKGTFFVNLGNNTFPGKGTVAERLKYLVDKGFEIGNHTMTHINLKQAKSAGEIQKEIGGNQKKMYELMPGYTFVAFSLPYGLPSKDLQQYVEKGEFEGVSYQNKGIVEVGWDPAYSPYNAKLNLLSIHRVRASGIVPVEADLAWWLKEMKRDRQFVSDGDPQTVTVPGSKEADIDKARLNGRKLVIY
jgi:hypothetical protein